MQPSEPPHAPPVNVCGHTAQGEAPGPAAATPAGSPTSQQPCAATRALARLLIHAAEGGPDDDTVLGGLLGRWRAWARRVAWPRPPQPVRLEIADLQGHPVFSVEALSPLTGVPLPAGVYHVSVRQGDHVRRYTVALESGTNLDLHLQPRPVGPD